MNKPFRLLLYFAVASLCLVPVSCEEKEEEDEKLSMVGTVAFDLPKYMIAGESVTVEAVGITSPENVVYKWRIPEMFSDTVSVNPLTIDFPSSGLEVITVTAIALADGYNSPSTTKYVTLIDTSAMASLKNVNLGGKKLVDSRDGQVYRYRTIGSLDWFTQNLAYDGAGAAYENSPATHSLFGRFYYWNEATLGESGSGLGGGPQGLCPQGWSIPTNEDWEDLALAMSGGNLGFSDNWDGLGEKASAAAVFMDEKVWVYSPDNTHSNNFGWNALPLGNTQYDQASFLGAGEYAFFWSSSERNGSQAYYRYIYFDSDSFPANFTGKAGFGANVRCVRLAQSE